MFMLPVQRKKMHENSVPRYILLSTQWEDSRTCLSIHPRLLISVMCEWKSAFTLQERTRKCRVKVHFTPREKWVTLTEVWNSQLAPWGVSALSTVCFRSVVCWLPVWPQFIIYPPLIGLGVTQRNASRSQQPINGFNFPIRCGSVQESIKEVEPLGKDNDLYWPCVCRIDFLCYNVGWMLVCVKISEASTALEPNTCTEVLWSRNKTVILCTCFRVRLLIFGSDFISVFCFSRCCRSYGKCVQLPHKTQILPDRKQEIISLQ